MKACAIFFDEPLSYSDGLLIQEGILAARIKDLIPDTILFLEHLPVITCGVRSKPEQILLSEGELKAKHIEISKSSRGGAVTFHGPGQLVMYPIVKLCCQRPQLKNWIPDLATRSAWQVGNDIHPPHSVIPVKTGIQDMVTLDSLNVKPENNTTDVHSYLHNLEEVAIRTAADFGVTAYRRKGMTGAWTDHGKLAAIGVRFRRWVTYHGLSFNVNPDLSGFAAIIPCGLAGEKVAALKILLGSQSPALEKVRDVMADQFSAVFGRELSILNYKKLSGEQLSSLLVKLKQLTGQENDSG